MYFAKFYKDNLDIQLMCGAHKPNMRAVGDIFKREDQFVVQVMCFLSIPDLPLNIFLGLQDCPYWMCTKACIPAVSIIAV